MRSGVYAPGSEGPVVAFYGIREVGGVGGAERVVEVPLGLTDIGFDVSKSTIQSKARSPGRDEVPCA